MVLDYQALLTTPTRKVVPVLDVELEPIRRRA